jgi:hypothetical protein
MARAVPHQTPCARHVHVKGSVQFSSELNMFLANVLNIDKLEKYIYYEQVKEKYIYYGKVYTL